jgi:mRNA interferase YafQ
LALLDLIYETKFKKDLKLLQKRGKNLAKLFDLIEILQNDGVLPPKCRPHILSGDWAGFWELHIEPDWLLIYEFDAENLYLARTGTHSDLF